MLFSQKSQATTDPETASEVDHDLGMDDEGGGGKVDGLDDDSGKEGLRSEAGLEVRHDT
jgi:hypothetical protein